MDLEVQHIVSQVHINQLDSATGTVVSGWEIKVRDPQTNVIVPVFVPDTAYSPENVQTAVAYKLEQVRAVHALKF